MQSFADAAAESYGSGSSSGSRHSREKARRSEEKRPAAGGNQNSQPAMGENDEATEGDEEVTSPPEKQATGVKDKISSSAGGACRDLFNAKKDDRVVVRKRNSKGTGSRLSMTPDLNLPVVDPTAIVPMGLVNVRVHQLVGSGDTGDSMTEELLKRQRRMDNSQLARSAAAANGSPRRAQ